MFYYIIGSFQEYKNDIVIIENNNIAYSIYVGKVEFKQSIGEQIKIYTYLCIKDEEIKLYGFKTIDERNIFMKLISINGVGSKSAISILNYIKVKDLIVSIINGDSHLIEKCKGIGKKTAERIVLELKDKFKNQISNDIIEQTEAPTVFNGNIEEVKATLLSLGYSEREAENMIKNINTKDKNTEEIIKEIFKIRKI